MTTSTERLPRLLALVPYLQSHPGARLSETADLFGVTERQLRLDLELLFMCGLPGHGPGDLIDVSISGDAVTLSNADSIARPLRLTADEALALIVALRALADVPGLRDRDALDGALAKLEDAAGDTGAVTGRVSVVLESAERALAIAERALAERRALRIVYHVPARDETTERVVDPMRLAFVSGRAYLEAWCRRAEGVRLFRLDRVVEAEALPEPAAAPAEATPRDLSEGAFQRSDGDLLVTLRLAPPARWVADYYPCDDVVELADGSILATVRASDPIWVRRLALRLMPDVEVLSPPEIADDVREQAVAALAAYSD